MALDESAVSDLLDALRTGEGTDLVRELAQWALQQLIEVEATAKAAREGFVALLSGWASLVAKGPAT